MLIVLLNLLGDCDFINISTSFLNLSNVQYFVVLDVDILYKVQFLPNIDLKNPSFELLVSEFDSSAEYL